MSLGIERVVLQRFAEACLGLIHAALLHQGKPQVGEDFALSGLDGQSLLKPVHSAFNLAGLLQAQSQVVHRFGVVGALLEGALQCRNRIGDVPKFP